MTIITLIKQSMQAFARNNRTRLDAALAYYIFASFFPLSLIFVSLVGVALSYQMGMAEDARQYVIETVSSELPPAMALLEHNMHDMEDNSGVVGIIGLLTGIWAASNIFVLLENAFNVIFDAVPAKMDWKKNVKSRLRAIAIVFLLALLMLASLLFGTFLSVAKSWASFLPGGYFWAWLFNCSLSLILTALLSAALFKYLPRKEVTWQAAFIGGIFSASAWQIGRELLTWWLGNGADMTVSNLIGSVLAFLALIYYASLVLMFGAQLAATYDTLTQQRG